MTAYTENTRNTVTREVGLTGKLVVGGTVSTGLLLGGYAVGAMALAGRINGSALLLTSLGLFIVGAAAGLVLSLLVGLIGREDDRTLEEAIHSAGKGILYAIPATAMGSILAGWIALTLIGLYAGKVLAVAGSALAALVGLVILAATFQATRSCGANAYRRVRASV